MKTFRVCADRYGKTFWFVFEIDGEKIVQSRGVDDMPDAPPRHMLIQAFADAVAAKESGLASAKYTAMREEQMDRFEPLEITAELSVG